MFCKNCGKEKMGCVEECSSCAEMRKKKVLAGMIGFFACILVYGFTSFLFSRLFSNETSLFQTAFRSGFMKSCQAGNETSSQVSYCTCMGNYLSSKNDEAQLEQLYVEYVRTRKIPQVVFDAAKICLPSRDKKI